MKVRIENYGEVLIYRSGRIRLDIPRAAIGENAVTVTLPDTEAAHRAISTLARRNRALHVSLVDDVNVGGNSPLSDEIDVEETAIPDAPPLEVLEAAAPSVAFADFKSLISTVEKGRAGWWTVVVVDREIKVRAVSDDEAIEKAFEAYTEDIE